MRLLTVSSILFLCFPAATFSQDPGTAKLRSRIVANRQLPATLADKPTFEYAATTVNAESVLSAIHTSGIRIRRAWLPLDNRCMDQIGPRFTVELVADDRRIEAFGFVRGEGRLFCATRLKLFTVRE